jgi:acetylornithine deacetylase
MSVAQINEGSQHNVVPAECHFVIDVRACDAYKNEEVNDLINAHTKSRMDGHSFRLNSSSIAKDHPIVTAGIDLDRKTYGSPTISDQALLSCPSLKIGPGKSSRSHSADEYIELKELEEGIEFYINIFKKIL